MKKRLGVLALTLASLATAAACASSSGSSRPDPPYPPGDTFSMTRPTGTPAGATGARAIHAARPASR
jgi:ABC-type oligopeptide transport system substrate-binding subunit